MAYPHTYGNSLRMYDQALYKWLDNLKVDYGEISGTPRRNFGILRVLATPRRAMSRMENILVRKGWLDPLIPGSGSGTTERTLKSYQRLPLPFVSVYVQSPIIDETRNSVASFRGMNSSIEDLTSEKHPWPIPITLPIQLDFWMKKKFTEIYIKEWVLSNTQGLGTYANEFMLTVTPIDNNGVAVWGSKLIPITIDAISDQGDLDPGEGDRLLRTIVSMSMKAWLFLPSSGTLHHVKQFNISSCRKQKLGDPEIEYSDLLYYRFNLLYFEGWEVKESDDDYTFETENDETIEYTPGVNILEYMGSNPFPVDTSTYLFQGKFKGAGTLTIGIYDTLGSLIIDDTFTLGVVTEGLILEFTPLAEDVYEVRLQVTGSLLTTYYEIKKKIV